MALIVRPFIKQTTVKAFAKNVFINQERVLQNFTIHVNHMNPCLCKRLLWWHPVKPTGMSVGTNIKNAHKGDLLYNEWLLHKNMMVDDVNIIRELIDVRENYESMIESMYKLNNILLCKICFFYHNLIMCE